MNQINYEVRDAWGQVAGWFIYEFDAVTFLLAQMKPEGYTIHEINNIVTEDN